MKLDVVLAERMWRLALLAICGLILLFLVLPIFVIIPFSFNAEPYFSYPIARFSTRWYEAFFASESWRRAVTNSVIIAVPTMLLATALGTSAALGLTFAEFRFKSLLIGLFLSPMMIPNIIIGLGLFFFYVEIGIAHGYLGMILAHTTIAAPFVLLTVAATLANFNMNLVRAASILGAGPVTVFFRIILPLILPGVLSGMLFAFIVSFDEVIIALLLADAEHRTLPRQIWSGVRESVSPEIMAVATLLVVLSTAAMLLMEWFRRRSERLRAIASKES